MAGRAKRTSLIGVLIATGALGLATCASGSGDLTEPGPTTTGDRAPSSTTASTSADTTTSSRPTTATSGTTTGDATTAATGNRSGSGTVLGLPGGDLVVRRAVTPRAASVAGSLRTPDGRERTYRVYVPSSIAAAPGDGPVPLLVALHGGTGSGAQFERNSGFDGVAEANGFLVVYPDGIGVGERNTLRTWNGGACCGPAMKQDVDDVAFIRLLIERLRSQYPIDPNRTFAAGHSNGGILAYRLACELSDQIVAIGVQSTALEIDACHPSHPVSVLHIHGSGDANIPITGGKGPKAVSGVAFNRPFDAAVTLAEADGCPAAPVRSVAADDRDLTISAWSPCEGGTQVAFVEVKGASHAWMGHATGGSGTTGPAYAKLDSSLAIWNFLSQHARR